MVRVFAPASVGNVGPGFDVLGMAITGPGDIVEAEWVDTLGVHIESISGDDGMLPLEAKKNTAGIAAQEVLTLSEATKGVVLRIEKGIPGTGMGSSAASAVAGAFAVNALLEKPLPKEALLPACIEGERYVSGGVFLDNLAASLYGGVVVCHTGQEQAWKVGTIPGLQVVVVTPEVRVLTRDSRGKLADRIEMSGMVHNMAAACSMVAAVAREDGIAFGKSIDDRVVEPQRSRLIRGFDQVKSAAIGSGALGCSISGAGASVFAVCERPDQAERVGIAMATAFAGADMSCTVTLSTMDGEGARVLDS